ncbi:hypothetical protein SH668x_001020 [Planctomicrobium sp. SH668]|uniref:hypothetical protein n=1 Tax=Planctomicrobium sp. SH668 TaxID=3448126 RepID=UPI003F5AEDA2
MNDVEAEVAMKLYLLLEGEIEFIEEDDPYPHGKNVGFKQVCDACNAPFLMTLKHFIHIGFLEKLPINPNDEMSNVYIPYERGHSFRYSIGGAVIEFVREISEIEWSEPKTKKEWFNVFKVSESTFDRMRKRCEVQIKKADVPGKWVVNKKHIPQGTVK